MSFSKNLLPGSPYNGYSDADMLYLSSNQKWPDSGYAPWASWEAENSSFGRTIREWASYPAFFPICAVSDHAVHWESRCWPNEVDSAFDLYLTWNSKKADKMRLHDKHVLHIPHPWISYRKKHYVPSKSERFGTLVYFPHSNDLSTPTFDSLDAYILSLRQLPAEFHPLVICVSFHDVRKGLCDILRPYGFPLVTAGCTQSRFFVDRFYSLARNFRYTTSPNIGSHSFYLAEAGIPFFLYGTEPTYILKGSSAVPDGELNLLDYGDEEDIQRLMELRRLFSDPCDEVTNQQIEAVSYYMGADAGTTPELLCSALWQSLKENIRPVSGLYLKLSKSLIGSAVRTLKIK